jgi:hypothetical protein
VDWALLGRLVERLGRLALEMADDDRFPVAGSSVPTPPSRCAQCGSEPWIVRWGSIRIGQQLDGFYYQATAGQGPRLLCRGCWHSAIGIDDPLVPTPS